MAASLCLQVLILLNARLFKVFSLKSHGCFTVAHLRRALGVAFHIPSEHIYFTLVSGSLPSDKNSLYDLRGSDGNTASLDVGLSAAYATSSLAGRIISFQFRANTSPAILDRVSSDGIQEIPVMLQALKPAMASSSNERCSTPGHKRNLSREERIALRAQLEDPFSVASKSCFEDDSDEEDEPENASEASDDSDDDLYSDDGVEGFELSSLSSRSSDSSSSLSFPLEEPATVFWPSDPLKLTACHLRRLLHIIPARDLRREVPLRSSLLRFKFHNQVYQQLHNLSIQNHHASPSTHRLNSTFQSLSKTSHRSQDTALSGSPSSVNKCNSALHAH